MLTVLPHTPALFPTLVSAAFSDPSLPFSKSSRYSLFKRGTPNRGWTVPWWAGPTPLKCVSSLIAEMLSVGLQFNPAQPGHQYAALGVKVQMLSCVGTSRREASSILLFLCVKSTLSWPVTLPANPLHYKLIPSISKKHGTHHLALRAKYNTMKIKKNKSTKLPIWLYFS